MPESSTNAERLERVVQIVAPDSTLLRIWPLHGGISAKMTGFEIETADGQVSRMILRRPSKQTLQRNPRAAEDEFKVLQLTKSLGLATQTPYHLDQSGTIYPTPYLIIEYIEGKTQFPLAPGANFTFQLAKHLAQIHRADLSKQDISFLAKAAKECVEVSGKQPTDIQPALEVHQVYEVLEKVTSLPERNKPVLLHGDFWPGNLLWRDGMLVAVIDWEDAQIGDPLIDFAISRLEILWIFGIDAMQSFTHDYQSLIEIDYTNLPYWDLCAALRLARLVGADLAEWTAFFIPYGRHDITEHTFKDHFHFFIKQAAEKLRIR